MLRPALKGLAALAIASAVWMWCAPSYVALIAPVSQRLVNLDPRLRHLDARAQEGSLILRGGAQSPDLPLGMLPADQLTYNVILLAGLFAMRVGLFRRDGLRALLIALIVLVATHIIAVATGIEYVYAATAGPWSDAHYSGTEQDFWKASYYSYQLAGMFAVAFALWWVSGSSEARTVRVRPAA